MGVELNMFEEEKYKDMAQPADLKNAKELTEIEGEAHVLIQNDVFSSVEKSEDFSNYISYMGRSHALSSKEKLTPDQQEQLKFMEGNAREFKTGDWRSVKPIFLSEKCKQCGLCFPVCPDDAIPVNSDLKREDFDYDYCKGCGVCAKVCPFGAIEMKEE